ncbi:MAG: hypothetical protein R3F38_18265 [Gammaproteobacteria bacterium]
MRRLIAGILTLLLAGCGQPLEQVDLPAPIFDAATAERLATTTVTNMDAVLARKALLAAPGSSTWLTLDPYRPALGMSWSACTADANCRYNLLATGLPRREFPASSPVYDWWQSHQLAVDSAEVCGVRLADDARTTYALQTFADLASLQATPDAILTHYHLRRLLHSAGSGGLRHPRPDRDGEDLQQTLRAGGQESLHAGDRFQRTLRRGLGLQRPADGGPLCAGLCEYLWAGGAAGRTGGCSPVDADGNLNPCLLCDEMLSGPGFQYSAGRIRRNSGILSEIERPDEQVYPVNHDYF